MKTSNKVLWISGSSLIGLALAFLLVLRISTGSGSSADAPEKIQDRAAPRVSRTLPLSGFTGIEIQGRWEVDLRRGAAEQVVLEGPEGVLDGLHIRKEAERLVLKTKEHRGPAPKLKASITMPSLEGVGLKGAVDLDLNGFEALSLSIRTEGVTSVQGKGNSIQGLRLKGEGVSRFDLRGSPVTRAELDYEGVFKIKLSMAGGRLSGRIRGVGEVSYDGAVSEEAISREGPCRVQREETF